MPTETAAGRGEDAPEAVQGTIDRPRAAYQTARTDGDDAEVPLDVFLMQAVVSAVTGSPGTPSADRLREAVAVLLELDRRRPPSWFAVGLVAAASEADLDWPGYPAPAGNCRTWQVLGLLTGLARSGSARLVPFVSNNLELVTRALRVPDAGPLAVDVAREMLGHDLLTARTLVERLPPFAGPARDVWEAALARCDLATSQSDHHEAQNLRTSLLRRHRTSATPQDLVVRALLQSSQHARGQRAWAQAERHLAAIEPPGEGLHGQAEVLPLRWEHALVSARLNDLATISPVRTEQGDFLTRRLECAEADLREVAAGDPTHAQAAYLLACLALARGDDGEARSCFERVVEHGQTGVPAALVARSQLWCALLELDAGDPAVCAGAAAALLHALRSGVPVAPAEVDNALASLVAMDAPEAADLLDALAELPRPVQVSDQWLTDGLRAHPDLIRSAGPLSRLVLPARRIRFLGDALELAARSRADLVDGLLDLVDDELAASRGWHEWADILTSSEQLASLIDRDGIWVDLLILNALVEGGLGARRGQFLEVLTRVAAHGRRGVDLEDLIMELSAVEDPVVVEHLREHCTRTRDALTSAPVTTPPRPAEAGDRVRICFVGGSERERRTGHAARRILDERGVTAFATVSWHHPGWGSNWAEEATAIESEYGDLDALVLMPLVRTNFGRRIRRTSGQSSVPWFACTGKGAHSMANAVEMAASWAAQRAR